MARVIAFSFAECQAMDPILGDDAVLLTISSDSLE